MKFKPFSEKQLEIFKFPHETYDALLLCGAVRTGKTHLCSIAFIEWLMNSFNNAAFAFCGKTVSSVERNIIQPLLLTVSMTRKYQMKYNGYHNTLTLKKGSIENVVHCFGGKDVAAAELLQGVTLSGVLFDEAVLLPQNFIEQGVARCLSVDDSLLWFTCNPGSPSCYFYQEWVSQPEKHNAKLVELYLEDNPGLSDKAKEKALTSFSGVFKDRFINNLWVNPEGLVYDMFDPALHVVDELPEQFERFYVSNDHGVQHKCVFLLIGVCKGVHYVIDEYVHHGEKQGQKTPNEYLDDLMQFIGDRPIKTMILDVAPIASGFNTLIHRQTKLHSRNARNDVLPGIVAVQKAFNLGLLKVSRLCTNLIAEMSLYSWNSSAKTDEVVKENDDSCDCLRYYIYTERVAEPKSKPLMEAIRQEDDAARRIRNYKKSP